MKIYVNNVFKDIVKIDDIKLKKAYDACLRLHDKWSKLKYGIYRADGSYNIPSAEYFDKHYRFLSEGFTKHGIGVCWDYVSFGRDFFNNGNVKHSCYYILTDTPPDYGTHTIIVCEVSGKFVYVESSFGIVDTAINGVAVSNDMTDIFKLVTSKMFLSNHNPEKFNKFKYDVYKFTEEPPIGSTAVEYMDWMVDNAEIIYQGEAFGS